MKQYTVTFTLLNKKKQYTLEVYAANREVVPVKVSQAIEKPLPSITILNIEETTVSI